MSFENTKMVISGGYASSVYFDLIKEVAGTDQPLVAFDTSPRVTQENYDNTQKSFTEAFKRLKLPDPLWLQDGISDAFTLDTLERGLEKADVLLVTGGATKHAYKKWQAAGMTRHILELVQSGSIAAAGGSAGAMIWFSHGYTDSMMYEVPEGTDWDYTITPGSGLFKSWVTAHHTDIDNRGRNRQSGFVTSLEERFGQWEQAIGFDTGAALVCMDGIARVKDVTLPVMLADSNLYIYSTDLTRPRVLSEEDTIPLMVL